MIRNNNLPTITQLQATEQPKSQQNGKRKKKSKVKYETIADMMKAMKNNPDEFVTTAGRLLNSNGRRVDGKKKAKRSRARVERPKQKYVYASQRRALEFSEGRVGTKNKSAVRKSKPVEDEYTEEEDEEDPYEETRTFLNPQQQQLLFQQQQQQEQLKLLRSLGLNPASQVADAIVGNGPEELPRIIASVRVDGNNSDDDDDSDNLEENSVTSNSFAYVMYKPVGWSILGEKKKGSKKSKDASLVSNVVVDAPSSSATPPIKESNNGKTNNRVKAYDEETDDFYFVEYNEADVLAALTPEEQAELMNEGGLNLEDDLAEVVKAATAGTDWDDTEDENVDLSGKKKKKKNTTEMKSVAVTNEAPYEALPRMKASINSPTSPSLVNWLKQLKAEEGTPIKGGKHWVALAGATEIDDSGLVFLCPRDRTDAAHIDRCGYVAIVGNGKKLASRSKLLKASKNSALGSGEMFDDSTAQFDIRSRLKTGRDRDPVMAVAVTFPDGGISTCSHAVALLQDRLNDGVRGDALGDPLDRRASRRLVHCESMSVSSLVNLDDEPVVVNGEDFPELLPDDLANYAYRRDYASFVKGSFLGRQNGLASNGLTNAYREINGATDGFPGWTVDRYDKWLFVQHQEEEVGRGPLPSLHDGYTTGVYYLPTKADRSVMGSTEKVTPTLLEGQPAPDYVPVMENGITYHINLGESFSTGIFLDQRLQRAWLKECCNEDTRVLNCFAHTGAFSVVAATAGAKTVSLDLDKKWLDRVRPQMEANGVSEWEGHHDCIYGDCFDWLARLAKRGEQFDIVILDPPSTSVGGKKKKRWSVKNDMAELVALAAPLVKSDGLLFTTTNSASLPADKFAAMCKKGLMDAGKVDARLERVAPMPSDFLSVGMQPVKNLVWRVP